MLPDRVAAAAVVHASPGHASRSERLGSERAPRALQYGLNALLCRHGVAVPETGHGVSDEFAPVSGVPVQAALRAGPPRANRKPVHAVPDEAGPLRASAKVELDPPAAPLTAPALLIELGDRYVRHEQAAAGARVGRIQSSLLQLSTHDPAALPSGREGNVP